jgi:hypothetical protein
MNDLQIVLNRTELIIISSILVYEYRGDAYKIPYPHKMQRSADTLTRLGLIQPNLFGEYAITKAGQAWWDAYIQWKIDHGQLWIN